MELPDIVYKINMYEVFNKQYYKNEWPRRNDQNCPRDLEKNKMLGIKNIIVEEKKWWLNQQFRYS